MGVASLSSAAVGGASLQWSIITSTICAFSSSTKLFAKLTFHVLHHSVMLLQMQLLVFLLSSVISVTASGNYQILYAEGLSSYNEEEWNTAIDKFERALSDYKEVKKARETCYKECSGEKSTIPSDYVDDEQLHFFHTLLQKSSCRNKCKKRLMGSDYKLTERVSAKIEENMANGEIHNYIQMSMFNVSSVITDNC